MKTLHFAAVGLGNRSELLDHLSDPAAHSAVLHGADPSEEARRRFSDRFPDVEVVSDYRELLAVPDLDGVIILSPDYLHREHACSFLHAGVPVYLEKPIATSISDADAILDTARRTGTKLFLGHNMRYFPCIIAMKDIIAAGTIGEVQAIWCRHFIAYGGDAYFRDWHSERRYTASLLLQKGAHDIDVIHWLAGGYTRRTVAMGTLSVYNRAKRRSHKTPGDARFYLDHWPPLEQSGFSPVIDVEDHSMVLLELDNGVFASYTQCHYTPDTHRNYTVIGTRGRIENFGDHGRCRIALYTSRNDTYAEADRIIELDGHEDSHGGADPAIVRAFLDYVRNGTPPNPSPIAAREAVAAGYSATESLRSGANARTVPEPSEKNRAFFS